VSKSLLTLVDVAAELSCSLATVKRRVRAGALPVVRDGRLVRVRASDLDCYLLERVERGGSVSPSVQAGGVTLSRGARLWD
jgi:excisionase family DNA binding protein